MHMMVTCLVLAVVISVTKEGVKFSTRGDIGTANIVCRQNTTVDKVMLFKLKNLPFLGWPLPNFIMTWVVMGIRCRCFLFWLVCVFWVIAAGGSNSDRDEWAGFINICTEIHELLHKSNPIIKHCYNQLILRVACCGWVQDCRDGLYQVLLGTQDRRGWGWDQAPSLIPQHFQQILHSYFYSSFPQDGHFLNFMLRGCCL